MNSSVALQHQRMLDLNLGPTVSQVRVPPHSRALSAASSARDRQHLLNHSQEAPGATITTTVCGASGDLGLSRTMPPAARDCAAASSAHVAMVPPGPSTGPGGPRRGHAKAGRRASQQQSNGALPPHDDSVLQPQVLSLARDRPAAPVRAASAGSAFGADAFGRSFRGSPAPAAKPGIVQRSASKATVDESKRRDLALKREAARERIAVRYFGRTPGGTTSRKVTSQQPSHPTSAQPVEAQGSNT